jgi:methyl-accepting chemotaxis protein
MNGTLSNSGYQTPRWQRFSVRVALSVLATTLLALAIVGWLVNKYAEVKEQEQRLHNSITIVNAIGHEVSELMLQGNGGEVWQKVLDTASLMVDTGNVSRITLLNRQGQVRVATDASLQGHAVKLTGNPDCPACGSTNLADFPSLKTITDKAGNKWLRVVSPISAKPECNGCHGANNPAWGLILTDFALGEAEKQAAERGLVSFAIAIVCGLILSGLTTFLIGRTINRQLGCEPAEAAYYARKIASGDYSFRIESSGQDPGSLIVALKNMVGAVAALLTDIDRLSNAATQGNLSARVDVSRHQGDYRRIVQGLNETLDAVIVPMNATAHTVERIAQGDIPEPITEGFPGDFLALKNNLNLAINNINALITDTAQLSHAAMAGKLSTRTDASRHQGDYRRIVQGINETLDAIIEPIEQTVRVLSALARADLTEKINQQYQGTFARLRDDANTTVDNLARHVLSIKDAVEATGAAARQIAAGNADLSQRTEQQAASLAETASSMEQLATTVKLNADSARQASELAAETSGVAIKGGDVVRNVVDTMNEINESSQKVVDIIGVIDGLAFQTNILALNAAVEAARAGEQGRGFAVVASEVRTLAQRSAAAAREIKQLISDSVEKVENGSRQVEFAGQTMQEIVFSVKRVTELVSEISTASMEQSAGIDLVNKAVSEMDAVTQQNAALVEQAAASAESLEEQAEQLQAMTSVFRLP